MDINELKALISQKEKEKLEFKEWKDSIPFDGKEEFKNRRCLLGYCVAIGNEGGGNILIGVNSIGKIVGTSAKLTPDTAKKIFDKTGQKIKIEEIFDENNLRVIALSIPSRQIGQLLKYAGVPLMRISDSLEIMSDEQQRQVLMEGQEDFSARICTMSSIDSIDPEALKKLRSLYEEKHKQNKIITSLSDEQFLVDMSLMKDGKLTYAGVILLAKESFLKLNMANAEICFEYRNKASDLTYNDRVDYRKPFVLSALEIWGKISSRQQVHPIIEGLFRRDIPAFNEEVFREALFNAVCHRDYEQQGSIFIKQSPEYIEFINPGGFPKGITSENILSAPSTPRNRLLAEIFQKVFLGVERSGQGADKIFQFTIEEGKGMPDYSKSNSFAVTLIIPAMLQDPNFVKYLQKIIGERQITFSLEEIILLERIRKGEREGITLKTVKHLLDLGVIELHGKTRGAQYILSRRYYSETGKLGERTRRIGLSRDTRKELILAHLRKNSHGKMTEFIQIFPELTPQEISRLLKELKMDNKIISEGSRRWAKWKIKNS